MEIALISNDSKKELMTQFCIAYCGILSKHHICATNTTGKYVEEATGLKLERLLSGEQGGLEQIISRISYDEIDLVLDFRDTTSAETYASKVELWLNQMCDQHNIPLATNIATAEVLLRGLDQGDLDYREGMHPALVEPVVPVSRAVC